MYILYHAYNAYKRSLRNDILKNQKQPFLILEMTFIIGYYDHFIIQADIKHMVSFTKRISTLILVQIMLIGFIIYYYNYYYTSKGTDN